MSAADRDGAIDFDFFDDGEGDDVTKSGDETKIGPRHLSKESLHQHDRITTNNNTRPYNGGERVDLNKKYGASHYSIGSKGSEPDSNESESGSVDGQTSRTVSSRNTNISVKVPTAADDINTESDSDDHDNDDDGSAASSSRKSDRNSVRDSSKDMRNQSHTSDSVATDKHTHKSVANVPQTVGSRNHKESWTSDDVSDNDKSYSSNSDSEFSSGSKNSESDDDGSVTDVSPLHSPESSRKYKQEQPEKFRDGKMKLDSVRFAETESERTPGYSIHGKSTGPRDTEARELSMLLKAVLEMDECPTKSELDSFQKQMTRPSSGKSRRDGSGPHLPHHRMNMSFSNDEVRKIDRENQRLLGKIINNKTQVPTVHGAKPPLKQMSHAAVRRMKEQKRIESENMQILKRIEAAKTSPTVRKENLTRHYQRQVQYSNQVGKSPHRPSSGRRTGSTYANKMAKASSMTSLNSDFSRMSGTTGSRPSSGRHSIVSDVGPPGRSRPAWDDHWHAG